MDNEIKYGLVSKELLEFRELQSLVHPLCEKLWAYDTSGIETEQHNLERLELMDKIAHIIANAWLDPLPYRDRD